MDPIEKRLEALLSVEKDYREFIAELNKIGQEWFGSCNINILTNGDPRITPLLVFQRGRLVLNYTTAYGLTHGVNYVQLKGYQALINPKAQTEITLDLKCDVYAHCKTIEQFAMDLPSLIQRPFTYGRLLAEVAEQAKGMEKMAFVTFQLKRTEQKLVEVRYVFGRPYEVIIEQLLQQMKEDNVDSVDGVGSHFLMNDLHGRIKLDTSSDVAHDLKVRVDNIERYGVDRWIIRMQSNEL